jgi:hypothetical protein
MMDDGLIGYLPAVGFLFCALAGIGGGIAFDGAPYRQRKWRYLGLATLIGGAPLGLTILWFSLP